MARLPRLVAAGHPQLLTQRALPGTSAFVEADDCIAYLRELAALARTHGVAVHAYVLLPDRVHLLVTPDGGRSPGKLMQALGRRYVAGFNARHGRAGSLWSGRFLSSLVQPERWLLVALRFVEQAPIAAGLVTGDAAQYRWSSAAHHVGLRSDAWLSEHPRVWALGNTPFERQAACRRLLDTPFDAAGWADLARRVRAGWALADADYNVGSVGRPLQPRPRGRPRQDPQAKPD